MDEWMNEWMNESIFQNSKLQNQLLKVSVKFKIHFAQFTNLRLLLTANKLTRSNTYFDVSYRKHFFTNWFFKRSLVCYMVNVNEEYVKDRCYFLEKNTTTNSFWQLLPKGEDLPFWERICLPISEESSPFGR